MLHSYLNYFRTTLKLLDIIMCSFPAWVVVEYAKFILENP